MASQGRQPFENRNGSTGSDTGSWASRDTVRDNQNNYRSNTDPSTLNGRNASPFPGNAKMDKYGFDLFLSPSPRVTYSAYILDAWGIA